MRAFAVAVVLAAAAAGPLAAQGFFQELSSGRAGMRTEERQQLELEALRLQLQEATRAVQLREQELANWRNTRPLGAPVAVSPAPDPALLRAQMRLDALEAALADAIGRIEQLEFKLAAEAAERARLAAALEALELKAAAPAPASQAAPSAPAVAEPAPPAPAASAPVAEAAPALAEAAKAAPAPAPVAANPQVARAAYANAQELLLRGDHAGAETAFRAFLDAHPDAAEASDARFWLAEAQFVQRAFGEAAQNYVELLRVAPTAQRAPDAMVKLAASLRELNRSPEACQALAEFRRRYPAASSAAKQRALVEAQRAGCAAN